jgi:hypothetical protein
MSASKPATRAEFRAWCLRELGEPVIRVNVAPEQVEDKIDFALGYFQRNHYDGSQHLYLPVAVTQDVLDRGYFEVHESIIGITRVLEWSGVGMAPTSPDITINPIWQIIAAAAMTAYGCVGCAMCNDGMTQYAGYLTNINTMRAMFANDATHMEFSRHMGRLYIYGEKSKMKIGTIFVVECSRALIPEEFPAVWNNEFLKLYATAQIKRQWGNNLRKLRNVPLSGGVMLQGEEILQEAEETIRDLEDRCKSEFQEPPLPRFM